MRDDTKMRHYRLVRGNITSNFSGVKSTNNFLFLSGSPVDECKQCPAAANTSIRSFEPCVVAIGRKGTNKKTSLTEDKTSVALHQTVAWHIMSTMCTYSAAIRAAGNSVWRLTRPVEEFGWVWLGCKTNRKVMVSYFVLLGLLSWTNISHQTGLAAAAPAYNNNYSNHR